VEMLKENKMTRMWVVDESLNFLVHVSVIVCLLQVNGFGETYCVALCELC